MNKDIKINKKQLKLLAIEVLLHNAKSDYDRRNKFDDYVVRLVVEHYVEDGYEVILNPIKYIKQVEHALKEFDSYPFILDYYDDLLSTRAVKLKREFARKRDGLPLKRVSTEQSIEDSFAMSHAFKMNIRKRMSSSTIDEV